MMLLVWLVPILSMILLVWLVPILVSMLLLVWFVPSLVSDDPSTCKSCTSGKASAHARAWSSSSRVVADSADCRRPGPSIAKSLRFPFGVVGFPLGLSGQA